MCVRECAQKHMIDRKCYTKLCGLGWQRFAQPAAIINSMKGEGTPQDIPKCFDLTLKLAFSDPTLIKRPSLYVALTAKPSIFGSTTQARLSRDTWPVRYEV